MEEVKMNWLSDQNGNLLAPKTLIEAVQNAEGTSLEELLNSSSGLPEVYIGNEEPTEEGIEIFIDTSESPEEHYTIAFADTPIGTIISYMGNTAPKDYLICDGTEYEIAKYKDLAEHIKTEFGSYNYFGGDGTTTFAVPDLRGEFLRGSGENSRDRQGSGANVGEHQDATEHQTFGTNQNGSIRFIPISNEPACSTKSDSVSAELLQNMKYIQGQGNSTVQYNSYFTSRPTNTSVLYCIKYKADKKSANIIPQHEYSTEEKVVGTWIDGKPIYEKVIKQTVTITSQNTDLNIDVPNFDFIQYYIDMNRVGTNEHIKINFNPYDSTYALGGYINYDNNTKIGFRVGANIVGRSYNLTMIFRYAKTTD